MSGIVMDRPGTAPEGSKVRVGETVTVVPSRSLGDGHAASVLGLAGPVVEVHRGTLDVVVDLPGVGRRTLRQRQVEVVSDDRRKATDPLELAQNAAIDLGWQIAMRWNPVEDEDRRVLQQTLDDLRDALVRLRPIELDTPPLATGGRVTTDRPLAVGEGTVPCQDYHVAGRRRVAAPPVVIEAMGCE